jgi:hypothetical protein
MNNSINFFGWIRDGVKQSVLLGVSDAIETIGTPEDSKGLHPNVAALLRNENVSSGSQASVARIPGQSPASKKRLGKSLRDIGPNPAS